MTTIDMHFVQGLTLAERAALVTGADFWYTAQVPGVERVMFADGPAGIRKPNNAQDTMGLTESEPAVAFPSAALLASSFDEDLLHRYGQQLGAAAAAKQVSVLLGPEVNLKRNPLAGRNFEYLSEDPLVTGRLGTAFVKGVQSAGVGIALKHFAVTNRESHRYTVSSNVDERALRELYLAQFEKVVKAARPAAIMCAYNRLNGVPMSENQRLLTGILRDEWGFTGMVMSDWGAVVDHVAALKAGLDLEMPGKGAKSVAEIVQAVKAGRLDEMALNRAALRVLQVMHDWARPAQTPTVDFAAKHQFARELAAQSMVLLQNWDEELPLDQPAESIAVIGELAAHPHFMGRGSSQVNPTHVVTPLAAMPKQATYAQGYRLDQTTVDPTLVDEAVALAKRSDHVVIFAGYPDGYESEGLDHDDINLPDNQNELIAQLAAIHNHVTVVLQNGAAITMPWAGDVTAILESYLAGEAVGEATWDVLTGAVNPSGKLAESFPVYLGDNPATLFFNADAEKEDYREGIFVGYRYYDTKELEVRFPFGHGMSYTDFAYDDLQVEELADTVKVTATVKNIGDRAGKEVVQLYVVNEASWVAMPAHELRGFEKVSLAPGEATTVTFELDRRAFSWYNAANEQWQADNGHYEIQVGSSSRDIRLQAPLELTLGQTRQPVITADSYLDDIEASADPVVQIAFEQSGLKAAVQPLLDNPAMVKIMENLPLRVLVTAGVDDAIVQKFLNLVLCG